MNTGFAPDALDKPPIRDFHSCAWRVEEKSGNGVDLVHLVQHEEKMDFNGKGTP